MADVTLELRHADLGTFTFAGYEIPEMIAVRGKQKVTTHELVGGARVVDVLGSVNDPIGWKGRFQGPLAQERARDLDILRLSGDSIELAFGAWAFDVVITSLQLDFERFYQIPYTIECLVLENKSFTGGPWDGAPKDGLVGPSAKQANANAQEALDGGWLVEEEAFPELFDASGAALNDKDGNPRFNTEGDPIDSLGNERLNPDGTEAPHRDDNYRGTS